MKNKTLLQSLIDKDKIKVTYPEDKEIKLLKSAGLNNHAKENKGVLEFYPPGTKVTTFGYLNNKQKLDDVYICNVIFSGYENTILYNLGKRYINEETDFPDMLRYNNVSVDFFTVAPKTKKWKYKLLGNVYEVEENEHVISMSDETDAYISLDTIVGIDVDILNNSPKPFHKIESIRIDEDLNVYYGLSGITDRYFTNRDLSVYTKFLSKRINDKQETLEETSEVVVKIVTIEM